jgi:hypothetical protein
MEVRGLSGGRDVILVGGEELVVTHNFLWWAQEREDAETGAGLETVHMDPGTISLATDRELEGGEGVG